MATAWTVWESNPGGGEIFRTCPDRPWGPSSLLCNGYRVFPGGKERPGRDADPHLLLVPWSRKSSAVTLLLLWAVRPVQSLSACTMVHFTFTLLIIMIWLQMVKAFRLNALSKHRNSNSDDVIPVVYRKTNGEVHISHETTTMVLWICDGI